MFFFLIFFDNNMKRINVSMVLYKPSLIGLIWASLKKNLFFLSLISLSTQHEKSFVFPFPSYVQILSIMTQLSCLSYFHISDVTLLAPTSPLQPHLPSLTPWSWSPSSSSPGSVTNWLCEQNTTRLFSDNISMILTMGLTHYITPGIKGTNSWGLWKSVWNIMFEY